MAYQRVCIPTTGPVRMTIYLAVIPSRGMGCMRVPGAGGASLDVFRSRDATGYAEIKRLIGVDPDSEKYSPLWILTRRRGADETANGMSNI